jgi:hypothetical protein
LTKTYDIEDPRPRHLASPFSFQLPCDARIAAIAAGDMVKAIFVPRDPALSPERMWCRVVSTTDGTLSCRLENQPYGRFGLDHDDEVELKRTDVISIDTDRKDDPPETNVAADWPFMRCLVQSGIAEGTYGIARIVRDEPKPDGYDDGPFPWSGWRFESHHYSEGRSRMEVYALVVPMRAEGGVPGYAHLLESAPHGSILEADANGVWSITGTRITLQ